MWRPIEQRSSEPALAALEQSLPRMLVGSPKVAREASRVAAQYGIQEVEPAAARADALLALAALKDSQLDGAVDASLTDDQPAVRAAAREVLFAQRPEAGLPALGKATLEGELIERQRALQLLAESRVVGTNEVISQGLDKLLAGEFPEGARLELLEAAARRADGSIKQKLARYEEAKPADDPLRAYRETLVGGDAERGRRIFFERGEVSCVRCHKAQGVGGDVGPELTKIGAEKDRQYLLESIVLPNKAIAKNFESILVITDDGLSHSGIVREETERELRLMTADGKLLTLAKESIEERQPTKSAMPEDLVKHLNKRELRDLVEFLSGLK